MEDEWLRYETTAADVRRFASFLQRRRLREATATRRARMALWLVAILGLIALALMALLTAMTRSLAGAVEIVADPTLRLLAMAFVAFAYLMLSKAS